MVSKAQPKAVAEGQESFRAPATSITGFSSLPLEVLQNIASYMGEVDLKAFASTDRACCKAALREKVVRVLGQAKVELKELAVLAAPLAPYNGQAALSFYKRFLEIIFDNPVYQFHDQFAPPAVALIQSKLTEIVATSLNRYVLDLNKGFFEAIQNESLSWDDIDLGTRRLEEGLVAMSMIEIINAAIAPDLVRSQAVYLAATLNHPRILEALLRSGPMVQDAMGHVVAEIVRLENVEILELMLPYGGMSDDQRGMIVAQAAHSSTPRIVQMLLASGSIPEARRTWALERAATRGEVSIMEALLDEVTISQESRGGAIVMAAIKDHKECIHTLLENGDISDIDRGNGVNCAANGGFNECIEILLENGSIPPGHRGSAVIEATRNGHLKTVKILLANGSISLAHRSHAVRAALKRGHYQIASELIMMKTLLMTAFVGFTAAAIDIALKEGES